MRFLPAEAKAGGQALVAVRDAVLIYRGQPALRGVDLDLAAGTILALLGPNGAGKTSLMRLVAGRLAPSQGRVRIAGGDPFRDAAVRRLIGWVPQAIALYPRLTVSENLDVFAQLAGLSRSGRRRAVPDALERSGTATVAGRLVGTLSGGFQRRVNIAASLVASPRLILLDEPTQGVDLEAREAIHAVLAQLRAAGSAILLSTHDFTEAERLADRIVILRDGQVLREGMLGSLLRPFADAPPEHEVRLDATPSTAAAHALRRRGFAPCAEALNWRSRSGEAFALDAAGLLAGLRGDGVGVTEIRLRRPGLETLYRDTLTPGSVRPLPALADIA